MRLAGAAPKLHAIIAPMQTCIAIRMFPAVPENGSRTRFRIRSPDQYGRHCSRRKVSASRSKRRRLPQLIVTMPPLRVNMPPPSTVCEPAALLVRVVPALFIISVPDLLVSEVPAVFVRSVPDLILPDPLASMVRLPLMVSLKLPETVDE